MRKQTKVGEELGRNKRSKLVLGALISSIKREWGEIKRHLTIEKEVHKNRYVFLI